MSEIPAGVWYGVWRCGSRAECLVGMWYSLEYSQDNGAIIDLTLKFP